MAKTGDSALGGFRFDGEGKAVPLSAAEILALPARPKELTWVDVQGADPENAGILSRIFHFHQLAIDDCLSPQHHPKIDEFEDHLFLIFRGIDFDLKNEKVRTAKLACFLGENFLVTFRRYKMKSVDFVRERALQDPRLGSRGPDFLLHAILDKMVDLYFPELEEFERAIDELQDKVLAGPTRDTLESILKLKRNVLQLRRFAAPQRDVLNRLSRPDHRFIRPANSIYFRDIFDHTFRIADAIDNQRDVVASLMESYLSMISNRLNEIMKVLTIITTMLMPPTLIAGIYGMNFAVLPELKWPYGYAFALGLMALSSGGMYWWLRRRRWL